MSTKRYVFLAVIIIIFSISLLFLFKNNDDSNFNNTNSDNKNFEKITIKQGNAKIEIPMSYNIIPQTQKKRKWVRIESQLSLKFGGINDSNLLYPVQIEIDKSNNIYVLDMKAHNVKKYNRYGDYIKKFGRSGRGPGEFMEPIRFSVLDGKIAVADPVLNKCVVFNNEEIFEIPTKVPPMDLTVLNSTELAVLQFMNLLDYSCIQNINFKKKNIRNFETIIDKNNFNREVLGMLPFLNGKLHSYNNRTILVPNILPYFMIFSKNKKLEKVVNVIDKVEARLTEVPSAKMVKFPHPDEFISSESGILKNHLFILSNIASKESKKFIVDIYAIDSGEYKYSFALKNNINSIKDIKITKNYYIILNDELQIKKYLYNVTKGSTNAKNL